MEELIELFKPANVRSEMKERKQVEPVYKESEGEYRILSE